ncbi:MAG: hypothetical protein ABII20_01700 [Candidatus Omnitrophota bacterium]|nr:hypothetical protein [Candidatus Omnitrophota bacterium]MBA3066184.1 hypothetical protein [bacterium]MBU2529288.1 hypothetical protein [bacterium]MBU3930259.1 hypothetical protein [bacterium]MBU4123142.1 hypothetical protein [bacterium]
MKYKRSILNVLFNVSGAKRYLALLAGTILIFVLLLGVTNFIFIKSLQLGPFAEIHLARGINLIFILWLAESILLIGLSGWLSLVLSRKIAGPIKRLERVLDEIIGGKNSRLVLRDGDALFGLAERINILLEKYEAGKGSGEARGTD